MKLPSLLLAIIVTGLASMPAEAQRKRPERPATTWEVLGETRVGFGVDRDVISIGRPEDQFRDRGYARLRIEAVRGDFRMRALTLRYINGYEETLSVERELRAGQSVIVDLPERRSFLSQITLTYGARPGIAFDGRRVTWNRPIARVSGENVGRLAPPTSQPKLPPHWKELASATPRRGASDVVVDIGRKQGSLARWIIWNEGRPVRIERVDVRYGNGQVETIRINQSLDTGEQTDRLSVIGETRFIDSLRIHFADGRGRGVGPFVVFGTDRPGRGRGPAERDPRHSWELLGEGQVSFRAERISIRVAHDEAWYSTRGFDRLHLISARGTIQLNEIRLVYINGYTETVRVDQVLEMGAAQVINLPGRRSYIKEIQVDYRARRRGGETGVLQVYGEVAGR